MDFASFPAGVAASVVQSHHGDLRQSWHVDPGEGLELATLLELLQDFLETALELCLALPDKTLVLLPLQPLDMVLLGELHPESVQVLPHLERTTTGWI